MRDRESNLEMKVKEESVKEGLWSWKKKIKKWPKRLVYRYSSASIGERLLVGPTKTL
jgi:hypothetical protein